MTRIIRIGKLFLLNLMNISPISIIIIFFQLPAQGSFFNRHFF